MIMKLKNIYTIFIIAPAIFISCLGDDADTRLSSDARFVSLTFLRNDSIPGLQTAVFRFMYDEQLGDTIIVNPDSLPFGTRIDGVWPVFQFRSTFFAQILQITDEGDSIGFMLNGNSPNNINDTVNFTLPETWVQNTSADAKNYRRYRIKVNVHQVEPELYVWRRLNNQITTSTTANQRAVFFGNRFLFYVGTETGNLLYVTEDTVLVPESQWERKTLNFNPEPETAFRFRQIVENRQILYVTDNANRLYASTDGKNWNEVNHNLAGSEIQNLLFSMNDVLWAIFKTNAENEYHLAFSENGEQWTDWGRLPERDIRHFPISNYATLVFSSPVGRPKVIIVGGTDREGLLIPANWIGQVDMNNRMVFEPLRTGALPPLQDAALIQYDNKIILFGGVESNGNIIPLRESRNEGLNWNIPDSAFNKLPADFTARSYQSVIVSKDKKHFYLIGGRNNTESFSDVWRVKLNRMYWAE